jgi:hypothetical protein
MSLGSKINKGDIMAEVEKKSLPKITTKNYWGIRKKLKSTMPKNITKSFVAASMSIKENSAQMNVIGPMKQMGLINDDGSPTKLANEWRDDSKYAEACKKIRESVYPQELLDLAPSIETDKSVIQSWIASHLMTGEESARQSTTVYLLLLEADPSKQNDVSTTSISSSGNINKTPKAKITKKKDAKPKEDENLDKLKPKFDQNLNINIQIHISADTSSEQIDKIFASMAKHLKSMNEE